jgi:putative chitinase
MINRKVFFNGIRQGPFPGKLSAGQVAGVSAILDEWERRGLTDLRHLSYILATPFLETGQTMQPIVENLNYTAARLRVVFPKYFTAAQAQSYARNPQRIANRAYGGRMGNGPESSGDGWRYRGRGYVQITGRTNYAKYGIAGDPEKATHPDVAANIMFDGMIKGAFTGKKLSDYFNASKTDWVNARRIINGTDRAGHRPRCLSFTNRARAAPA